MVNSEPESRAVESPNFFDSLTSFKDRFISEAEDLFSTNTESNPQSRRRSRLGTPSTSSFDFSFPWSSKQSETSDGNPGSVTDLEDGDLGSIDGSEDTAKGYSSNSARNSVVKKQSVGSFSAAGGKKGKLKRENSIRVTNGKLENGTLLQYSAVSLTIQKIKPGDIPSFPEIIDDLHALEGADPDQVQLIVDKLDALKLTIASLDKRLEQIDKGLDNLRPPKSQMLPVDV